MAATALPLDENDAWPSAIDQAATPANRNSLRAEVALRQALSFEATQPGAPDDGDLYVLSAAWGDEVAGTLAYYRDGAWSYWVPALGMLKRIGPTDYYTYDPDSSTEWQPYSPGGGAVDSVNGATGVVTVPVPVQIAVSDETTSLTTGTAKVTFRMPFAMTLTAVRASVATAPTGTSIIVDINQNGSTILSTKLSIDATEKTSTTAATPPVISDTTLDDDAEITIDIDQIGSTGAGAGLKVTLLGYKTP